MTPTPAAAPDQAESIGSGRSAARHVAIIMDGNGRWAERKGLPRVAGHRAGAEAVLHIDQYGSTRSINAGAAAAVAMHAWAARHAGPPPG